MSKLTPQQQAFERIASAQNLELDKLPNGDYAHSVTHQAFFWFWSGSHFAGPKVEAAAPEATGVVHTHTKAKYGLSFVQKTLAKLRRSGAVEMHFRVHDRIADLMIGDKKFAAYEDRVNFLRAESDKLLEQFAYVVLNELPPYAPTDRVSDAAVKVGLILKEDQKQEIHEGRVQNIATSLWIEAGLAEQAAKAEATT